MPWLDGGPRIRARASTAGGPRGEGAGRERETHRRDGNNGNVELPHLACPFILSDSGRRPAGDSRKGCLSGSEPCGWACAATTLRGRGKESDANYAMIQ